jgi:hypothetical protein
VWPFFGPNSIRCLGTLVSSTVPPTYASFFMWDRHALTSSVPYPFVPLASRRTRAPIASPPPLTPLIPRRREDGHLHARCRAPSPCAPLGGCPPAPRCRPCLHGAAWGGRPPTTRAAGPSCPWRGAGKGLAQSRAAGPPPPWRTAGRTPPRAPVSIRAAGKTSPPPCAPWPCPMVQQVDSSRAHLDVFYWCMCVVSSFFYIPQLTFFQFFTSPVEITNISIF